MPLTRFAGLDAPGPRDDQIAFGKNRSESGPSGPFFCAVRFPHTRAGKQRSLSPMGRPFSGHSRRGAQPSYFADVREIRPPVSLYNPAKPCIIKPIRGVPSERTRREPRPRTRAGGAKAETKIQGREKPAPGSAGRSGENRFPGPIDGHLKEPERREI